MSGVVSVTGTSVHVRNDGLDVVVALNPLQQLRYLGSTFTGVATVETFLGQQKAPCAALWIESTSALDTGSDGGLSHAAVHCRVGDAIETAADLPAVLTLTAPHLTDVVAVPLIYLGLDRNGHDYVARVREGSDTTERPVVVGFTDGVRRVILSGLSAGDVLEPISQP